LYILQDCLLR